jgi:hypothetical protein
MSATAADAQPRPLCMAWCCELPGFETINRRAISAFEREKQASDLTRSHHFHGRFENLYIPAERLPEFTPIFAFVEDAARRQLATQTLRWGFWFNEMPPGHRTSLHSHEELDERLSAVYYLSAADDSGDLVLHEDDAVVNVRPRPGLLVMFPPDLPHEVAVNRSGETRLSVAFNFGPAEPGC